LALVLIAACGKDEHHLPKVGLGSATPDARDPSLDRAKEKLAGMFGPKAPAIDVEVQVAKLEAQRAGATERERALIDRGIAAMRAADAAGKEPDPEKARPLHLASAKATISFLEDSVATSPDVETTARSAASLQVLAATVEALELWDDLPPGPLIARARAMAAELVKRFPDDAKAWALVAAVAAYADNTTRLRGFSRCVKLDPKNAVCVASLTSLREAYVRPYCEPPDLKAGIELHAASKTATSGAGTVTVEGETWYLTTKPRFTSDDIARVQASSTLSERHLTDGTITREAIPGVHIELRAPASTQVIAWSRAQAKLGDGIALTLGGRLLLVDDRPMLHEGTPGVLNIKLEEFCKTTKTRALP